MKGHPKSGQLRDGVLSLPNGPPPKVNWASARRIIAFLTWLPYTSQFLSRRYCTRRATTKIEADLRRATLCRARLPALPLSVAGVGSPSSADTQTLLLAPITNRHLGVDLDAGDSR